jgi:hypothetical protein
MERSLIIERLLADTRADEVTLSELKAFLAAINDVVVELELEEEEMTEEEMRNYIL